MKQCNSDEKIMYKTLSFKVKDVPFNSMFYLANNCLLNIASILDFICSKKNIDFKNSSDKILGSY